MIEYKNWPVVVRCVTAFSTKRLLFNNLGPSALIGYISSFLGLLMVATAVIKETESSTFENLLMSGIGYFLIGATSLISSYSIAWIINYSSWDERFKNKSLFSDKLGSVLFVSIGVLGLLLVIKGFGWWK